MFRLLRQRSFSLLWFGGLISMVGDWLLIVGLPYEVYRRTGSTLATGAMVLAFLVPSITLGSIAGVIVDRWDRRRLMVVVDLLLAIALMPLLAVDAIGIWVAYAVLLVSSALEQLFEPAQATLVPRLVDDPQTDLLTANALIGVGRQLARLIGPAIGGVLIAVGGLVLVTLIDAGSFLVSALMLLLIRLGSTRSVVEGLEREALTAWQRLVGEWRDGLAVIWRDPVLRALLLFFTITRVGEGLTLTLFVPWVNVALHSNGAGYGALLSTQAIGGLVGALVIGQYGARANALLLVIGGALCFGIIDLVLFTYPVVYPVIAPALVGMVIVGVPGAAMMAGIATLQQTQAADSHRGRVVGAMAAMGGLGSLVGAVGAGVLGQVVPVVALLVVQGSGYVIGSLVVLYLTRGRPVVTAREPG